MTDGATWECTRCQARRYNQSPAKIPNGWEWRMVYTVSGEKRTPTRFDARCQKCIEKEPPPKVLPPAPRERPGA